MRALRYLVILLAGVVVAHLAWSTAVVALLHTFYGHRALNIAKVPRGADRWEQVASAFAVESMDKARRSGKPLVMFLGSSVTYGYPWHEPVIYSRLVAQALPDREVVNLSMVGGRMRSLTDFTTCALDATQRPAALVVEIPLINSVASVQTEHAKAPRSCARPGPRASGYWLPALTNPFGVGWIALLWDEEAYAKPEEDLRVVRVPPDYFANRQVFAAAEAAFVAELRQFLTRVSTLGDKVYVYVSPIYTPAIEEAGGDRLSVQHQIDLANQVCQEVKGVICLDTRPFGTQKDLFYNLTHLNQRGHRALADWFVRQVAR